MTRFIPERTARLFYPQTMPLMQFASPVLPWSVLQTDPQSAVDPRLGGAWALLGAVLLLLVIILLVLVLIMARRRHRRRKQVTQRRPSPQIDAWVEAGRRTDPYPRERPDR